MSPESKTKEFSVIGKPTNRIDGPLKVSGKAQYSADYHLPGMLFAVPVGATIAHGRIESVDISKAEKMPGVKAVYFKDNFDKLYRVTPTKDFGLKTDEMRPPFEDNQIRYYGQYVAVAVAQTIEQATAAADAVVVKYAPSTPNVDAKLSDDGTLKTEHHRGDAIGAFSKASVKIDQTYTIPPEFHSAIELHASVADFDGTDFTLYETTQAIGNHRNVMAQILGVNPENVKVISKFLGSGFGGKLWPWTHSALAAGISRKLKKPVKLVCTRKQVFQTAGHRPQLEQRVKLGATQDGKLVSIEHDSYGHSGMLDKYLENCGEVTKYFYSCPNVKISSAEVKRHVGAPTSMRGPGAVPGLYATESALDELAIKLDMDPVELRLLNEPQKDEGLNIPFASRHLVDCFKVGSEKFGWKNRNPKVGSMKKDGLTLGWGTAGAGWIAERIPAEASVELRADGTARVASGTQDIGTGTYTVLGQMAAEELNLPLDRIEVSLGDSDLPPGPLSGGSMVTGSLIPAVEQAAKKAIDSLLSAAVGTPSSPFFQQEKSQLEFKGGKIRKKDGSVELAFEQLIRDGNFKTIIGKGSSQGTFGSKPTESRHSYGAHFVEVTWQPETARLRVNRVVTAIDAGKILNPKAGRNQIEGAIVMGIGMAMLEAGHYEHTRGAILNGTFADYLLPVNADVPALDIHFLEFDNKDLNSYGARGIGEIGLAGFAAAVTNAVYHATGVRVRDLPVRIEDLLKA